VACLFIPQRNVIHERCRQQLANESVEEFARELQALAVHCEYKEQTNEMVRDRFVMGVRDRAVKQKLQLITDPSLDKAMTIARQHEQVKLQMIEQQLEQEQHVAEARVSSRVREQLVDTRSRRTDTLPVSTVTRCQGTA